MTVYASLAASVPGTVGAAVAQTQTTDTADTEAAQIALGPAAASNLIEEARNKNTTFPQESIALAKRALEILAGQGLPSLEVEALSLAGRAYSRTGRYDLALEYGEKAVALAEEHGIRGQRYAAALSSVGSAYQRLGKLDLALDHFEQAHNIRRELNLEAEYADSLIDIGNAHALARSFDNALRYYGEGRAVAARLGQNRPLGRSIINSSYVYIESNRPEKALEILEPGRELAERIDNSLLRAHMYHNTGEALYLLGRDDESQDYLKQSLKLAGVLKLRSVIADNYYYLGRIALRRGDITAAKFEADRGLAIADENKEGARQRDIRLLLSDIASDQGDFETALEHYRKYADIGAEIVNTETNERLAVLESELTIGEKEREIETLKRDAEIRDLQLAQEKSIRRATIIAMTLLFATAVILSYGLWTASRAKSALAKNNKKLVDTQKELERASQVKADFLAITSHEIRTPLNGVLGMAELLLGTSLQKQQKKYVETIKVSGDILLALLNDILDFSKIESGGIKVEAIRFSVPALLGRTFDLWSARAEDKNLELTIDIGKDVPELLIGDPTRIQQILFNLISNAIKFTNRGRITVHVAASFSANDQVGLHFSVRDTGIGITPSVLEKVFEPFEQGESGTNRLYGGTGLGLSICRRLVHIMGGEIEVESSKETGSVFSFWVNSRMCREEEIKSESRRIRPAITNTAGALKILVAEDNPINQAVIRGLLEKWGHHVEVAADGREACHMVEAERYDIVLMDIHMPGIDGIEAARRIRALDGDNARIPIIALTADAMAGDREQFLEAGMDDYVAKPIEPAALDAAIHRNRGGVEEFHAAPEKALLHLATT